MIRGFEEERYQSALAQRWEEYNYADGWRDAQWGQANFDDLLRDTEVKDRGTWRKLTGEEKYQIYIQVYNIGADVAPMYRKYYVN